MKKFITNIAAVFLLAIFCTVSAYSVTETWFSQDWIGDKWVDNEKSIIEYTGNKVLLKNEMYKLEAGVWKLYNTFTWTYDGNGNQISFIMEGYEEDVWVIFYKNEFKYDANGNQIESLIYWLDEGELLPSIKTISSYEGFDIIEELTYMNEEGEWILFNKSEYSYDGNTVTKIEYFHIDDEEFMPMNKTITEYKNRHNDEIAQILSYSWDFMEEDWKLDNKETYIYNAKNLLIENIFEYMMGEEWMKRSKEQYIYDSNDNVIEEIFYGATEENEWIAEDRTLLFYNNNEVVEYVGQLYQDGEWVNNYRSYKEGASSVKDLAGNLKIETYPNPASDNLNIEINVESQSNLNIQVISSSGQFIETVFDGPSVAGLQRFNIGLKDYPTGTYILILRNGGNSTIKKFAVVK